MSRKNPDDALFAELRKIDTPTITNVVATYPKNPLCLGLYNPWTENWYTDQTLRCLYPELGPRCGYAVTCVFGLPDPGYTRLSFMDENGACKFPADKIEAVLDLARKLRVEETERIGRLQKATSAAELRAIFAGHSYTAKKP